MNINELYNKCAICINNCNADRNIMKGKCNAGTEMMIASATLHFSEEPCISGDRGSGTVFFSHCSMHCIYCQNYPISQNGVGNIYSTEQLADKFIKLQKDGAHNINLVTPTHYIFHIMESIDIARNNGLIIPIIYNTSSIENINIVNMLDGYIDVFLADIRYANDETALKYSSIGNYTQQVRNNLLIFRKLKHDNYENGIMTNGLIIRILVLPGLQSEAIDNINYIMKYIGVNTVLSIMSQYYPYYRTDEYPELNRTINEDEYLQVVEYAEQCGFSNIYTQNIEAEV